MQHESEHIGEFTEVFEEVKEVLPKSEALSNVLNVLAKKEEDFKEMINAPETKKESEKLANLY